MTLLAILFRWGISWLIHLAANKCHWGCPDIHHRDAPFFACLGNFATRKSLSWRVFGLKDWRMHCMLHDVSLFRPPDVKSAVKVLPSQHDWSQWRRQPPICNWGAWATRWLSFHVIPFSRWTHILRAQRLYSFLLQSYLCSTLSNHAQPSSQFISITFTSLATAYELWKSEAPVVAGFYFPSNSPTSICSCPTSKAKHLSSTSLVTGFVTWLGISS